MKRVAVQTEDALRTRFVENQWKVSSTGECKTAGRRVFLSEPAG